MLLFDWFKEFYDYILPWFPILGVTFMGGSLAGLIGYIWYFHGGNQTIVETLAMLLVLGGVMRQLGKKYTVVGRENEERYDPSTFE